MIEDKLSAQERVRLEALSQAHMTHSRNVSSSPEAILSTAKKYEKFISKGE